jgi:acetyl-CoA synthetase
MFSMSNDVAISIMNALFYYFPIVTKNKLDINIEEGDIHGCVADAGWITGHTYIVYGPLALGATTVMFESIPTYPNCYRYWDVVQRHKLTQFYTAPTASKSFLL